MVTDIPSVAQHALALASTWGVLRMWFVFDRLILRAAFIALFCIDQYGWAFLAFVALCIAEGAHRRVMAEKRAAGLYDGPWIE